jgi:hypothetical protein
MENPLAICAASQKGSLQVRRRESLWSASRTCTPKAESRTIVPGQDRVTALRQPCIASIASRLTRPSA